MIGKIYNNIIELSDYSPDILMKPVRWCTRNIEDITKVDATTPCARLAERVQRLFWASAGLFLYIPSAALAGIGILYGLILGRKVQPNPDNSSNLHKYVSKAEDQFSINHQALAKEELATKTDDQMDNDWKFASYFGHIRVINMDRDTKRLEKVKAGLIKVGVREEQIERFSAIVGAALPSTLYNRMKSTYYNYDVNKPEDRAKLDRQHQGQTGCYLSHYYAIKEASENWEQAKIDYAKIQAQMDKIVSAGNKQPNELKAELAEVEQRLKKYNSIAVIEDDANPGYILKGAKPETQKVGKLFRKVMSELPEKWDMFFFNAYVAQGRKIDGKSWIKKIDSGWDLGGYAVHSRYYKTILNHLKKVEDENSQEMFEPVDTEIAKLMKNSRSYTATPPLMFQGGNFSSIDQDHYWGDGYVQRRPEEWEKVLQEGSLN